jgi:hypothetical protein
MPQGQSSNSARPGTRCTRAALVLSAGQWIAARARPALASTAARGRASCCSRRKSLSARRKVKVSGWRSLRTRSSASPQARNRRPSRAAHPGELRHLCCRGGWHVTGVCNPAAVRKFQRQQLAPGGERSDVHLQHVHHHPGHRPKAPLVHVGLQVLRSGCACTPAGGVSEQHQPALKASRGQANKQAGSAAAAAWWTTPTRVE